MILPLNLPDIDDERFQNICIKHINKGLLKGVDFILDNYKSYNDETLYFKQFFPRGFYGDYVKELYRLKDVLTSKMLYMLGDFDKYVVMGLLSNYCRGDVSEYDLKIANTFSVQSNDTLKSLSSSMNYHVIDNDKDRSYVMERLTSHSLIVNSSTELLMASLEDLNKYIITCFADVDFLNLRDYTIEEMRALSTMKDYKDLGIYVTETRLHLPYVVIK